jgi:nicotinate-nucleotide adenylyltransferase
MIKTALLGGSFNPAHRGHRHISLEAMRVLDVDHMWWLVSPGNPLKAGATDMASLPVRMRSAQIATRHSRIRPTGIEQQLGTRFTIETLTRIVRRYPNRRFIWVMGGDNLAQFHQWRDWRKIAALMPIAVIDRPSYKDRARASRAMGWFRRFVRPETSSRHWTKWRPPALVLLRFRLDPTSATALRRADPDWQLSFSPKRLRDPVTHRIIY